MIDTVDQIAKDFAENKNKKSFSIKRHLQRIFKAKKSRESEKILENKQSEIYAKAKGFYKKKLIKAEAFNSIIQKITKDKVKYTDWVVLNELGQLLLVQRTTWDQYGGTWVIPGGHIDLGEEQWEAAKRELWEETGIELSDDTFELLGIFTNEDVEIFYYTSTINKEDYELVVDEKETQDYKWIDLKDIDQYPMLFDMKKNIKKFLNLNTDKVIPIIAEVPVEDMGKSLGLLKEAFEQGTINEDRFWKAMRDTSHLVPKKVQIKGKNGKTFTAIRWIDPKTGESEKINKKGAKASSDKEIIDQVSNILENTKGKSNQLRDLVNLGIYDHKILSVLTGTAYAQVRSALKIEGGVDVKQLPHVEKIIHDKIKEEQQHNDTSEELEENTLLKNRDVESLWRNYERNLSKVIKNRHKFALAFGTGGVGKTYTFEQLAEKYQLREYEEEIQPNKDQYDYVVISGKITPTQVYNEMYRHRDKLIVFDDCDSFLSTDQVQGFLKAGLDTGKKAKISNKTSMPSYLIPGDKESGKIPTTFRFTGRVIAITNLTAQDIDQAVKSRALASNLTMTVDETIGKLKNIVDKIKVFSADKTTELPMSQEARDFAFEILKENKDRLGADINTRILSNAILIANDSFEDGFSKKETKKEIVEYFESVTGAFDESIRKMKKK